MKTNKIMLALATLLIASSSFAQHTDSAAPVKVDTIKTADFDVLELDSAATAHADSLAQDSINGIAKRKGYDRFTIGLRGGAAGLLHNLQRGNWNVGGDVILDLQYAHYWSKQGMPMDLGIITGVGIGYSQSGMRTAVDTTYSMPTGEGDNVDYTVRAQDIKENDGQIQLEVPVMFSLIHENGLFFNVGPKFMLPVYTPYKQSIRKDETTTIDAHFTDYGVHVTDEVLTGKLADNQYQLNGSDNGNQFSINVMLTAEIGYEWRFKNGHSLGLGAFANYCVYNNFKNKATAKSLIDVTPPSSTEVAKVDVLSATKTYAKGLGYFDAGIKLAYHFNFYPKIAKPEPASIYLDPSYMHIAVVDAETKEPAKVHVSIYEKAKDATIERDIENSELYMRTHPGEYVISATDGLYFPATDSVSVTEHGALDSVVLEVRPRPWFRLLVTNEATGSPVAAPVRLYDTHTGDSLMTLHTDTAGYLREMLDKSRSYTLRISRTGYEDFEQAVPSVYDSLHVVLKPIKAGQKVILHNLLFVYGKTSLMEESKPALEELYQFLKDNPGVCIRITGHTDNRGSDKVNNKLSAGRANAVRDEMLKRGIDSTRITAEGKGKREPIATNKTEEGRARNRRVEFFITSTGGANIEQVKSE